MSNPRTGVMSLDPSDSNAAHVIRRLQQDRIGWLTTVSSDGTPQTSPVWFLWREDEILVYSLESARARNVESHPRVSLNLDGNGTGGDIVVVEGTAAIDDDHTSCVENLDYLSKYKPVMDDYGWTPEWFAERYCVPIVITPTKYRYW